MPSGSLRRSGPAPRRLLAHPWPAIAAARLRHALGAMTAGGSSAADAAPEPPYACVPITPHFGAYVYGFRLEGDEPLPPDVVEKIKVDMRQHRVLVFRGQGQVSGKRQVEISRQLGTVESTFYKHPKSPHPDIFRVSNDETEGCTNVGRTGWHIDGTFQSMPFKYQTMHFHSVCEGGEIHTASRGARPGKPYLPGHVGRRCWSLPPASRGGNCPPPFPGVQ
ncbi:unnamed protein product [Prorocentrum cordatum]|nr:unnamed protein product [Polarella glacialis]